MHTLADMLHPDRFPAISNEMVAVVGHILGKQWSRPRIAEMLVTSGGTVLARNIGVVHFEITIGKAADLERDWQRLLRAAGLRNEEQQEADRRYRNAVRDRRPRLPWMERN